MDILVPAEFQRLWETNDRQPVVKYPEDVLRQPAEPVERVNKRIRQLVARMKEVAKLAHGIGLAAPQVGVSSRVIIASIGESRMTTLINPRILRADGAVWGEEGCLSIPGLYGDVERANVVEVEAMDIEGKPVKYLLEGMAARVVQHEIDHLDGVLFIDKVDLDSLHWAWPAGAAAS